METVFKFIFTQLIETSTQSCKDLDFFRVMAVIRTVLRWSYELRNIFLKAKGLFSLRRLGSSLFHSITVDRKNEFLRKVCFILYEYTLYLYALSLSTFLVLKAEFHFRIILERKQGGLFL